jgi:sterol desaturase/sphingolipid hydroxylase (fatty acid hydroxylase superfamily)
MKQEKFLKRKIDSIWNYQFTNFPKKLLILGILGIVLLGLTQNIFDIFITNNIFGHAKISLQDYLSIISNNVTLPKKSEFLSQHFATIWIVAAFLVFVVRVTVIITGYFKSKEVFGEEHFFQNVFAFFSSAVLATLFRAALLVIIGAVTAYFGFQILNGTNLFQYLSEKLALFINHNIPTVLNVHSYGLALFISIISIGFPGYFIHMLCHESRFMWLVFHKPHHVPQILYPLAVPPTLVFEFFLLVPTALFSMIISKLVHTEPLVMEMSLWLILGYSMEIFNHSSVHYDFAYKNPIIRNLCRLFGDKGVYHIAHHSAAEHDKLVNLTEGPFQIWDRLFGTYRKPYESMPKVGLASKSEVKLNPLRIILSGVLQIVYELLHNKGFNTKLKIIFAHSTYEPPITKDFLSADISFELHKLETPMEMIPAPGFN